MSFPTLLLSVALVLYGVMVVVWLVSLVLEDTSIVDVAWGFLFILMAWLGVALGQGWRPRAVLVALLVTTWGVRLSLHIGLRNLGRGEDPRYAAWREEHGARWPLRSLFTVFLLQATIALVVGLPIVAIGSASAPRHFAVFDLLGATVWGAGFAFEAIADAQLRRFREEGVSGRVMDRGLWRYSRHPNYFGEAVLWWGVWLVAVAVPGGWLTLVGPVLLTWLLRYVSGVPMAERALEGRPGWEAYRTRTSPFVPMPPRER